MIEQVKRTPEAKRKLSVTYRMWAPESDGRDYRLNREASLAANRLVYKPITLSKGRASLTEISIVESPAWKESFYQVLP